jgi:hypothetical protein
MMRHFFYAKASYGLGKGCGGAAQITKRLSQLVQSSLDAFGLQPIVGRPKIGVAAGYRPPLSTRGVWFGYGEIAPAHFFNAWPDWVDGLECPGFV